ncbi:MAG: Txe/YoeB family addiction module toxin [Alphaproteobacteria bacterium]
MLAWKIVFTPQSVKDSKKITSPALQSKVKSLLDIVAENPYKNPPAYEKLSGDLSSFLSRRINLQHRLVYEVIKEQRTVKIIRMWTHYE